MFHVQTVTKGVQYDTYTLYCGIVAPYCSNCGMIKQELEYLLVPPIVQNFEVKRIHEFHL
jgi:hypothetical protein